MKPIQLISTLTLVLSFSTAQAYIVPKRDGGGGVQESEPQHEPVIISHGGGHSYEPERPDQYVPRQPNYREQERQDRLRDVERDIRDDRRNDRYDRHDRNDRHYDRHDRHDRHDRYDRPDHTYYPPQPQYPYHPAPQYPYYPEPSYPPVIHPDYTIQQVYIGRSLQDERINLSHLAQLDRSFRKWSIRAVTSRTVPNSSARTVVRLAVNGVVVASQTNPGRNLQLQLHTPIFLKNATVELWVNGSTYIETLEIQLEK